MSYKKKAVDKELKQLFSKFNSLYLLHLPHASGGDSTCFRWLVYKHAR